MDITVRKILVSKSRREIIKCLYASECELTGRELARRSGFSPQQGHNVLHTLLLFGIVEKRIIGPVHLFRLNRGDLLTEEVLRKLFADGPLSGTRYAAGGLPAEGNRICWGKAMEFFETMVGVCDKRRCEAAAGGGVYCCLAAACAALAVNGIFWASSPTRAVPPQIGQGLRVPKQGGRGT